MDKSADAFRTISEVSDLLETPAHVLRFWESRFPQIRPVKRAGGRRYYRPSDVALLTGIRRLLHEDGLTIRGVQKILREQGVRYVSGLTEAEEEAADEIDLEVADAVVPFPTRPAAALAPQEPPTDAYDPDEPDLAVAANTSAFDVDDGTTKDALAAGAADDRDPDMDSDNISRDGPEAEAVANDVDEPDLAEATPDDEPVVPDAAADTYEDEEPLAAESISFPESPVPVVAEAAPRAPETRRVSVLDDPMHEGPIQKGDSEQPVQSTTPQLDETEMPATEAALAEPDLAETAEPAPETTKAVDAVDAPVPRAIADLPPLTDPLPPENLTWIANDLRGLRRGRLSPKRTEVTALMKRLQDLRERMADHGRIPRR